VGFRRLKKLGLKKLGMMFREPADQEVEAAQAAFRAQAPPPAGPPFDDRRKAEEANDLGIGGVLEEPHGRPIPIETPEPPLATEESEEILLIKVIIPEIGGLGHEESLP